MVLEDNTVTDTNVYILECLMPIPVMDSILRVHPKFTKVFRSRNSAEKWAKDYQGKWPRWARWTWHCDKDTAFWVCNAESNMWRITPTILEG